MPYPCFMVELRNEREVPREDDEERTDTVYDVVRLDNDEVIAEGVWGYHLQAVPPGAMWWSESYEPSKPTSATDWSLNTEAEKANAKDAYEKNPHWYPQGVDPATGLPLKRPSSLFADGAQLNVMTPGGPWNIDSRASNCTMPFDYEHRCWVRRGEPPNVHVDKDGNTCQAGAGSIGMTNYHGFLHDGALT